MRKGWHLLFCWDSIQRLLSACPGGRTHELHQESPIIVAAGAGLSVAGGIAQAGKRKLTTQLLSDLGQVPSWVTYRQDPFFMSYLVIDWIDAKLAPQGDRANDFRS